MTQTVKLIFQNTFCSYQKWDNKEYILSNTRYHYLQVKRCWRNNKNNFRRNVYADKRSAHATVGSSPTLYLQLDNTNWKNSYCFQRCILHIWRALHSNEVIRVEFVFRKFQWMKDSMKTLRFHLCYSMNLFNSVALFDKYVHKMDFLLTGIVWIRRHIEIDFKAFNLFIKRAYTRQWKWRTQTIWSIKTKRQT